MTAPQPRRELPSLRSATEALHAAKQELQFRVTRLSITKKFDGERKRFPPGTTFHHRSELDPLQRELREIPGVTVLIYDQTCAAEKRRRRKKGEYPDPPRRIFINTGVCEQCGDCGVQSNCLSIVPVETEFGRKRIIEQASCNKDYSCVNGFCPSFVSVHGAKVRKWGGGTLGAGAGDIPSLGTVSGEGLSGEGRFPLGRDSGESRFPVGAPSPRAGPGRRCQPAEYALAPIVSPRKRSASVWASQVTTRSEPAANRIFSTSADAGRHTGPG
jgi:hypothetical protein